MKFFKYFPILCLLWLISFNNVFAQFQCPDFEFCIEQPDPNVPTYYVTLDFDGTLTGIKGFNVKATIAKTPGGGGANSADAQMVHPDLLGLSLQVTPSSILLTDAFIDPALVLSNPPLNLFSFSYTGDVGDCFVSKVTSGIIVFDDGDDGSVYCNGFDDFCTDAIDGLAYCFDGVNISGRIQTPSPHQQCAGSINYGLADVQTSVWAAFGGTDCQTITDYLGNYDCEVLPAYKYIITPTKQDNPTCGITYLDYLLLNHFIYNQFSSYTSWYQMIASDINEDNSVTTGDLVRIQQIVLGLPIEYNAWRFTPIENYVNLGPYFGGMQPFPLLPHRKWVVDPIIDVMFQDFVGFKIGDIDGSCTDCAGTNGVTEESGARGSSITEYSQALVLKIEDTTLKEGDEILLPIKADNFEDISGYGLAFIVNTNYLQILGVEKGSLDNMAEDNFNANHFRVGKITHVWSKGHSSISTLTKDDVLFYVRLQAKQNISTLNGLIHLNEGVESIAMDESGKVLAIDFALQSAEAHQPFVSPNPFKETTTIHFYSPTATTATVTIFDNAGKLLLTEKVHFVAGENKWSLPTSSISENGLFFYQIQTNKNSYNGKMLKIE